MANEDGRTADARPQKPTAKLLTAAGIGAGMLDVSGLTLAAALPVLLVFSPVLVPAVAVASLAGAGLLLCGGLGLAAVTALAWIHSYVTGKRPPGVDQLESARSTLAKKARDVKEQAKVCHGHYVKGKAQEVANVGAES